MTTFTPIRPAPVTVRPVGELDLDTVGQLLAELHRACRKCPDEVVVDLTQVTFLDAATLGVLVGAAADLARHGGQLTVAHPNRLTRRIIAACGLGGVLAVRPKLACEAAGDAGEAACGPARRVHVRGVAARRDAPAASGAGR